MPDVRSSFRVLNPHRVPGSDGICVFQACASQLAEVFTDILNVSLRFLVISACFKKPNLVPGPKMSAARMTVALTSMIMKCSEKLVKNQNVYVIALVMHTDLTHMHKQNPHVRIPPS